MPSLQRARQRVKGEICEQLPQTCLGSMQVDVVAEGGEAAGPQSRLIGVDPSNIDDCARRCVPEIRTLLNTHDSGLVKAFGGVELALWDIKGKCLNLPVYSLLGGPVRHEIGFSEYFALLLPSPNHPAASTPLEVARYCARMHEEHGSTIFEGKVGVPRSSAAMFS